MSDPQIHPAAREELYETIRHYAVIDSEGQGDLALAFESAFYQHADSIIDDPLLFNVRHRNTRRVNLTPRFGEHYIAYMIWREKVVILAVAHAKRRPYYWRKRIAEAKKLF
ncbi:type II toxin-antitoxin system RelE/ParE family toxin [Prosthecobacter sp.]|uniref:type II toxin-antitoxin system RelE/ParE family toxin n=1 Tax=Prosthecobacter sp. TaxID=1965333 RepID=UPI002486D647|nr:type II toxin-antitoxin system RelE/ParE family toxin [Prosthecobacter sp.]MDI1315327.1 type II toxin-antitoxin system RelE/ParE family toxin [Prosthecobacter sp.]